MTDPTGIYFEYKATAIGEFENEIKDMLLKSYRENMSIDEGIKLSISMLQKLLGKDFDVERIDGAYIRTDEKKFVRFKKDYIKKFIGK